MLNQFLQSRGYINLHFSLLENNAARRIDISPALDQQALKLAARLFCSQQEVLKSQV